jgi:glutathione S-transferase
MLTIYHVPGTRSVRVIWLCAELDLPHQVVPISFSADYRATPEYRKLNPVGKVPAMTDGDFNMFESGAMVQYILDRYGGGRLQPPAGTEEHARYLQWSWFAEATLARPIGEIFNHRRVFGEAGQIAAVVEEMKGRARVCLVALEDALRDRSFLVGDDLTGADVMMGYSLMLARRVTSIDDLPSLRAYWERLSSRPAFQQATATPSS